MAAVLTSLSAAELAHFDSCPVECKKVNQRLTSIADYFSAIAGLVSTDDTFWFRGHSEPHWSLTPHALRFSKIEERSAALELMHHFKRIAEGKLLKIPERGDEYKWAQIAQHYGLPTRLLDWTESAATALYFACHSKEKDGIVFVVNPVELNKLTDLKKPRILDPLLDQKLIQDFLKRGAREPKRKKYPLAVNPVWSSERLIAQKGTFTVHGTMFSLDKAKVPSLIAIPILKEFKLKMRSELRRVGVDEMTLFPELEHSCTHLRMWGHLMEFD